MRNKCVLEDTKHSMFLQLTILSLYVTLTAAYTGPDLPPGPYCGGICCDARKDDCSHSILGTKCYCDEFCTRNGTKMDDCCPDYTADCTDQVEEIRLETCARGSRQYYRGAEMTDNCNKCTCVGEDWECTKDPCIISQSVISTVNRISAGWRPANYTQFWGRTLKDGLRLKLGTLPLNEMTLRMRPDPSSYSRDHVLPSSFDARTRWPAYISPAHDQGWCGSDWAISVVDVASDRFAIQSNGAEKVRLSAQQLVSCGLQGQRGCDGGHIDRAWNFVRRYGLVDEKCFPYTSSERAKPCPQQGADLARSGCEGPSNGRTERYKTSPPKRLGSAEDIMYEIMTSGPVQAIMKVRQDFFVYRHGIYRHVSTENEEMTGLHSVRVVGWGEERGQKYWTVSNSWGTDWGEDGYFKIARGENESGIEDFVLTTLADVFEAKFTEKK